MILLIVHQYKKKYLKYFFLTFIWYKRQKPTLLFWVDTLVAFLKNLSGDVLDNSTVPVVENSYYLNKHVKFQPLNMNLNSQKSNLSK